MVTIKLKKPGTGKPSFPADRRPPVRGAGGVARPRPTLAAAQAERAERDAQWHANGPRPTEPRRGDPRPNDPRPNDPRPIDPRRGDPRRNDPRQQDPRAHGARPQDLRPHGPRPFDARRNGPPQHDPRRGDPRAFEPQRIDPRSGDPRRNESRPGDPWQDRPPQFDAHGTGSGTYPPRHDSRRPDPRRNGPAQGGPHQGGARPNDRPRFDAQRNGSGQFPPRNDARQPDPRRNDPRQGDAWRPDPRQGDPGQNESRQGFDAPRRPDATGPQWRGDDRSRGPTNRSGAGRGPNEHGAPLRSAFERHEPPRGGFDTRHSPHGPFDRGDGARGPFDRGDSARGRLDRGDGVRGPLDPAARSPADQASPPQRGPARPPHADAPWRGPVDPKRRPFDNRGSVPQGPAARGRPVDDSDDDEPFDAPEHAPGSVRVSKRMSELGIASRREADEWIAKGWVRVDDQIVNQLGSRVLPGQRVTVDAKARYQQAQRVTVLVNKPVGYVSGQAEDGYEPAVVLVTPENNWSEDRSGTRFLREHLKSLVPAGRLDIDSVGLLVLTQDGRVAKQLIGEDSEIEKEYLVRVAAAADGTPALSDDGLALLRHGLELDGEPLRPATVEWVNADQLRFVLTQGKKRQIRRMCEAVGLQVLGLKRVRIGQVMLGDLPTSQWRYLRMGESFAEVAPLAVPTPVGLSGEDATPDGADAVD